MFVRPSSTVCSSTYERIKHTFNDHKLAGGMGAVIGVSVGFGYDVIRMLRIQQCTIGKYELAHAYEYGCKAIGDACQGFFNYASATVQLNCTSPQSDYLLGNATAYFMDVGLSKAERLSLLVPPFVALVVGGIAVTGLALTCCKKQNNDDNFDFDVGYNYFEEDNFWDDEDLTLNDAVIAAKPQPTLKPISIAQSLPKAWGGQGGRREVDLEVGLAPQTPKLSL